MNLKFRALRGWAFKMTKHGYLPITRENRKFWVKNKMVRAIWFGKLQKIWAVI